MVSRLKILDKRIRTIQLNPNWAQKIYLQKVHEQFSTRGRVALIVLKGRQLGISTITEACLYCMTFIVPRYRSLIVAHETDAARNLLEMTKMYWDLSPWNPLFELKNNSRNDIRWVETGSSMKIATAGKKGAGGIGRSSTTHGLHASEAGFWEGARDIMLSLEQAIPPFGPTMRVIESTANGTGNYFEETWWAAEEDDVDYETLFLAWFHHPEYTAEALGIPLYNMAHLDDEEKIIQRVLVKHGIDWKSRLIWRRYMIKNKTNNNVLEFHQEYPCDPEEAFISSGLKVFPYDKLRVCYDPIPGAVGFIMDTPSGFKFQTNSEGALTLFRNVNPMADYMIGGDPTHTTTGDYACMQILNRHTLEQVAVWRAKCTPGTFADEMYKVGMYFNRALLVPEITGPGYMTVGQLNGRNYPNIYQKARPEITRQSGKVGTPTYGWETTSRTKPLAVGWGIRHVVEKDLILHDKPTFLEMKDFQTLENGSYGSPPDKKDAHDDTVMALCIVLAANQLDPAPARRVDERIAEIVAKVNSTGDSSSDGFQTFDEMEWN